MFDKPSSRIVLRQIAVAAVLLGFLSYNYERFDSRDWNTWVGVALGLLGVDLGMNKFKTSDAS